MTNPETPNEENHAKTQFARNPNVLEEAVKQSCALVDNTDNPYETLRNLDKMLPGLPFQYYSPDGRLIAPSRPDDPEDGAKDIVQKESGSVLPTNSNITTARRTVVIVEGAKQMIFAVAYAPDDVEVLGIPECWGWSSEGHALESLDALVEGKDVIVIFDAVMASTPRAYVAGKTLVETLKIIGAHKVTFACIPAERTVGLDDFLNRRRIEKRGEAFARILALSVPFAEILKPANWRKGAISQVGVSDAMGAGEAEIARVFDEVANGRYYVSGKGFYNNGTTKGQVLVGVGTTVKIDSELTDCVALFPKIFKEVFGLNDVLIDDFLIRDSDGRRTRTVRFGNETKRCFVITKAAWTGEKHEF